MPSEHTFCAWAELEFESKLDHFKCGLNLPQCDKGGSGLASKYEEWAEWPLRWEEEAEQ